MLVYTIQSRAADSLEQWRASYIKWPLKEQVSPRTFQSDSRYCSVFEGFDIIIESEINCFCHIRL